MTPQFLVRTFTEHIDHHLADWLNALAESSEVTIVAVVPIQELVGLSGQIPALTVIVTVTPRGA